MIFSDALLPIGWADVRSFSEDYGVKAATSLTIPRAWTPPFLLVPYYDAEAFFAGIFPTDVDGSACPALLANLAGQGRQLILRSSVIGETIWDRGTFDSVRFRLGANGQETSQRLKEAASQVLSSTGGRKCGLMLQRFIQPALQGEFGNLLRVAKTRDQWELATREPNCIISRSRLNSQRDRAADPKVPLAARAGLARERLFGGVGAWLNNELLHGRTQRLNCEWVFADRRYFLVQIDEEDEDLAGVNPLQVRVAPVMRSGADTGHYLQLANADALSLWDKLEVLEQLWEPGATHRPTLFYLPIAKLPLLQTEEALTALTDDFAKLIGPLGIIVRTSVPAGYEKLPNLARTECLTPEAAARWCFATAHEIRQEHGELSFAFVAHRFVASRASAWVRAQPANPVVEINALWGLPDALQYCPYDIWEVHVPTGVATDYPEYKSDMLISCDDGDWKYVRIKNELARSNSIGSIEAKDIALRSARIAERLGRACHIMWFVGCIDQDGTSFNIPWYWTEAHDAERNPDRTAYRTLTVSDHATLEQFVSYSGSRARQAMTLRPIDLQLMRNVRFIEAAGRAAAAAKVPVILSGSTLAHAYFQLRKIGCIVVTPSEKKYARARRTTNLGKLVRDKIPGRIAERQEGSVTRRIEGKLKRGFLISKLFEEALEVRSASEIDQKVEELADLFEVLRAIAQLEGISLQSIFQVADAKKLKVGGFEEGLVLLTTAIGTSTRPLAEADGEMGDLLGDQTVVDAAEIPFSFFGFMEFDQPRSIYFGQLGVRMDIVLRPDRLELRLTHGREQLDLFS